MANKIRRMLPHLLASGLTFFARILEDPTQVQSPANLTMLGTLVQFIQSLVDKESLDLRGVLEGCTAMEEIARGAVNHSVDGDVVRQIQALVSSYTRSAIGRVKAKRLKLQNMTHPMLVAQALLGNIPNRDTVLAKSLSSALSMPWDADAPFSPWVPVAQQPAMYGFEYGPA